jgi:hypothetical protein
VAADKVVAARNASNGALVLTLPRIGCSAQGPYPRIKSSSSSSSTSGSSSSGGGTGAAASKSSSRLTGSVDVHNMLSSAAPSCAASKTKLLPLGVRAGNVSSSGFIIKEHQTAGSSSAAVADDDDVPPLE